jgi:hypothetical protein
MNLSISEMFRAMESELEKFHDDSSKKKDLKLLVDFEQSESKPSSNPLQIESIKYKKKTIKKQKVHDLKDRNKKDNNSLF